APFGYQRRDGALAPPLGVAPMVTPITHAITETSGRSGKSPHTLSRMQQAPQTQPVRNKIFYLDACRASFMLLGIVLHSSVPFMTSMKWYITAPQQSYVLSYLYYFINAFRMPGFFLIAGFFSALMLTKRFSGPW